MENDFNDVKLMLQQNLNLLRDKSGYLRAGYPRYFTLFGRDSIISSLQLLSFDTTIAKATLLTLARYQGKKVDNMSEEEPGKILHEHRFEEEEQQKMPQWKFPYYGSVDSTPLFIILAKEYLDKTKDTKTVRIIFKNLVAAYHWIVTYGDKDHDGFIEYKRLNPYGLFHQGWRDGILDHLRIMPPVAIVEVQGYVYAAYRSLIEIMKKLEIDDEDLINELEERSEKLKLLFNEIFWIEMDEYFALALDGKKRVIRSISSNPGHLLFTGIIDQRRAIKVANRIFQDDIWTPYGFRTCSEKSPKFNPVSYHNGTIWPHDNWFLFHGAFKLGLKNYSRRIRDAILRAYTKLKKIPEFYGYYRGKLIDLSEPNKYTGKPIANPIQAWSTGALLDMLLKGDKL
ncbi:MAG: amylo-alpha-1,6-glucosidase [Candidatus Asgardarchaeia archaeon]